MAYHPHVSSSAAVVKDLNEARQFRPRLRNVIIRGRDKLQQGKRPREVVVDQVGREHRAGQHRVAGVNAMLLLQPLDKLGCRRDVANLSSTPCFEKQKILGLADAVTCHLVSDRREVGRVARGNMDPQQREVHLWQDVEPRLRQVRGPMLERLPYPNRRVKLLRWAV